MAILRTLTALSSLCLLAVACGGKVASSFDDPTCIGSDCATSSSSSGSVPRPSLPPPGTSLPPPPPPILRDGGAPIGPVEWTEFPFVHDPAFTTCDGKSYVYESRRYRAWVGVQLCNARRYKIYLGDGANSTFHEIADSAGSGEDHCELVDPSFTLSEPSSSDINSGSCIDCATDFSRDHPAGAVVYTRGSLGEPFELIKWPEDNHYTSTWYECGVSIP